jgi:recombinational DNA repair ATPase RecF
LKVSYIRLENVAGLVIGSNKDIIEIDFNNSINKIISIQSANSRGKTTLLSSITPFSTTTSLDDRSSLSYITPGENGFKEIHYINKNDKYIIKHYYKPTKDGSHTTKSYFTMNGEELNESGNITSFLTLVELHFGLTQEMMRLMRLGSNVNSFISLTPTRRKEYIGKLIEEIELYLKIHKKVNEDIRILKVLMATNNNSLYECHISDIILEEEKLKKFNKNIKADEKEYDKIISKISKIQSLENENNIDELKQKRKEVEMSLLDISNTEEKIKSEMLERVNIDSLISKRSDILNNRIETLSKINSYRISIDNTMKNIERLEMDIKKVISNNDIDTLKLSIDNLRNTIDKTDPIVIKFKPSCTSDDLYQIVTKLSSYNQIGNMIQTLGNTPIDVYIKLKRKDKSIDKFLHDQTKRNISRVSDNDLKRLFDQVFKNESIITPNCDTQFNDCPYYRFSEMITEFKQKLNEEVFDDEVLNYIRVISNNIDKILNEIDGMIVMNIPDSLKEHLREKSIIGRLENKLQLFDLSEFKSYLTLLREREIYLSNLDKLKQYEIQLKMIHNSGIDSQLNEIDNLKSSIPIYRSNISDLEDILSKISIELETIDHKIGLITKYNDGIKYKNILQSTLESTNKILIPLETSTNEKIELRKELDIIKNKISYQREEYKNLENKINEYKNLLNKSIILDKKFKDYEIIEKAVSTRKGIPVIYMKKYLGKIQNIANILLDLIYQGRLKLGKFQVTPETFEVPYIRNGHKISDVKYSSQSEISLITMALSFALANRASGKYNILLLDEIDAGLDDDNRSAFLKMLYRQMEELNSEQVFIISHNLNMIANIPMDVIQLSDINVDSKLQNVIYS